MRNVAIVAVRFSMVNCYLLKTGESFVLVDTGFSWQRRTLRKALQRSGCRPGNLKLVVITHGDFDHTGNCAWLRRKYGTPVAIHRAEAGVVEKGRMLLSRRNLPGWFGRAMIHLMGRLVFHRFKPDLLLAEGDDLSQYGLDARVIHVPGHSTGSIGLLTIEGAFFCGDLLTTKNGRPIRGVIVDDSAEMDASIERLGDLGVRTVYPGHGRPFTMAEFTASNHV